MALHLLHSDNFASYANDAAFQSAYPYDPPSDMTTSASVDVSWGATDGPDGQPGVAKTGGLGTFGFDKVNLLPQGHLFRVQGRWKFAGTAGSAGEVCSMWWIEPGNRAGTFEGNLFLVSYATTGQLSVSVKTTAGYANAGGNVYVEDFPSAVTPDVAFTLRVDGRRSTIVETSPGVFAPDPDGWLKVYVDGVLLADFGPMPIWLNESTLGVNAAGYYWNGVSFRGGSVSDIEIWDERSVFRLVAGVTGTVTADRAVLFSLDGNVNTNDTEGLFKVCGDMEVTGTMTVAGDEISPDISAAFDLLDT